MSCKLGVDCKSKIKISKYPFGFKTKGDFKINSGSKTDLRQKIHNSVLKLDHKVLSTRKLLNI